MTVLKTAALFLTGFCTSSIAQTSSSLNAHYVGSTACKTCHPQIYATWSKTRMANVIRDPREHPDAIIPDFSKPDPLLTFTKDDIAFVYGSKWKQHYFKKVGDDYSLFLPVVSVATVQAVSMWPIHPLPLS
jgi:hypothetical protein